MECIPVHTQSVERFLKGKHRKLTAHVAMQRVAYTGVSPVHPGGFEALSYLPCIHMQIPIDMTTFTYCTFALGPYRIVERWAGGRARTFANFPLLAFGHQCVWLTLLLGPLTPDYISICIHSRFGLILRAWLSRSSFNPRDRAKGFARVWFWFWF